MKRILIVIQARMGSTRLPGKVLKELYGRPLILRLIDNLSQSKHKHKLVVATSKNSENDVLEEVLKKNGVSIFRGAENDVLSRFTELTTIYNPDVIVRATADNPFMSSECMDILIDYLVDNNLDYTFMKDIPIGVSVEVVKATILTSLEKNYELSDLDREHVTYYITHHPKKFKVSYLDAIPQYKYPEMSLTIDNEEEFRMIDSIYEKYGNFTNLNSAIEFLKNGD